MRLTTITSDAKSSSDVTEVEVDVANKVLCVQIQSPQRICRVSRYLPKAHDLCYIQGHSPWRSNKNSRKFSLLLSNQRQRKNSSFSLSRKIQNEKGFTLRIRHVLGEVNQRMYATASDVDAVPRKG